MLTITFLIGNIFLINTNLNFNIIKKNITLRCIKKIIIVQSLLKNPKNFFQELSHNAKK